MTAVVLAGVVGLIGMIAAGVLIGYQAALAHQAAEQPCNDDTRAELMLAHTDEDDERLEEEAVEL